MRLKAECEDCVDEGRKRPAQTIDGRCWNYLIDGKERTICNEHHLRRLIADQHEAYKKQYGEHQDVLRSYGVES